MCLFSVGTKLLHSLFEFVLLKSCINELFCTMSSSYNDTLPLVRAKVEDMVVGSRLTRYITHQ